MNFALSIPAKLLLPLVAFGAIGLAVIPADFNAVQDVKNASVPAPKVAPSFNVAPLPVEVINKAPAISSPPPAAATSSAGAQPNAAWGPTWTVRVAGTSEVADATPTEPTNLTLEHVNAAVNVRSAGQKGSPVLFVLPAGAEVRVAETNGSWVHIYSEQGEGWIYSGFIGAPREATAPAADTTALSGKTIRVAGTVTVHDAPDGEPLYQLEVGEPIRILETVGKWARIATATGEGGWVRIR